MGYKVAIVGATGNVGRAMLEILAERQFPADEVVPLASRRSLGVEVSYGDKTLTTKALDRSPGLTISSSMPEAPGWTGAARTAPSAASVAALT